MKIIPTVGRVVLYWPTQEHDRSDIRHAATVASVLGEDLVNLAVADHNGVMYSVQNVMLADVDAECKPGHCEWMPYQKEQAAKNDDIEIPEEVDNDYLNGDMLETTEDSDVVTGDDLVDAPEHADVDATETVVEK